MYSAVPAYAVYGHRHHLIGDVYLGSVLLGLGGWEVAWVFDLEGQIGIIWGVTWGVKMALKWMRVKGGNTRLPPPFYAFFVRVEGGMMCGVWCIWLIISV